MSVDVLILNTAVADLRSEEFEFTNALVGQGGLAKCKTKDMPNYTQSQYKSLIDNGLATAGGPGNSAPLMAKAGLKVAVGVNLGKGNYDGFDAQGAYFHQIMTQNDIDMTQTVIHPTLPSGTTFIYKSKTSDRGGIAYFPNANNDFDFETFKKSILKLKPKVVYYMYSGLSDRGDANGGKDLADFMAFCRQSGCVTIVDSHTLTGNPQELIEKKVKVKEYELLRPLLPNVDIFFTSTDEAKMIKNTLGSTENGENLTDEQSNCDFLNFIASSCRQGDNCTKLLGVTVRDGAFIKYCLPDGLSCGPLKVKSSFMTGEIVDLVGAGDSFRSGLVTYVAKNIDAFKNGTIDFEKAVKMGNLFASLYIKAPLNDRYIYMRPYAKMLEAVEQKTPFANFQALIKCLG
jgi:sugar/nucleoside kinase (ribokinase family)